MTTTTNRVFFGFAMSDSMFQGNLEMKRTELAPEQVAEIIRNLGEDLQVTCNPSHQATIAAAKERYGIAVAIPETPPRVSLGHGDSLVVMTVRGLPRLTDRHEYTAEEIASATFTFARWDVL